MNIRGSFTPLKCVLLAEALIKKIPAFKKELSYPSQESGVNLIQKLKNRSAFRASYQLLFVQLLYICEERE